MLSTVRPGHRPPPTPPAVTPSSDRSAGHNHLGSLDDALRPLHRLPGSRLADIENAVVSVVLQVEQPSQILAHLGAAQGDAGQQPHRFPVVLSSRPLTENRTAG